MYKPSEIDSLLQSAARLATDYLGESRDAATPVITSLDPEALMEALALELPRRGKPMDEILDQVRGVLKHSVRTGHPRFLNQLFGGSDPVAILGEWMSALINTSMYTYETAPVATLMEVKLIERMNAAVGFHDGEGVFAPGGSISNLMCVLAARHQAYPDVKAKGLSGDRRLVLFLSDQAHYSIRRAAVIAGIGLDHAIDVESDKAGRMIPSALERAIEAARERGEDPFFVAATSGTTVPGAFDPLEPLTAIARTNGMWMHVDASYGGSVLLSRKHRHLMAGVEHVDSVTWNPHKLMGVPLACSATLMREKGRLLATNSMGADYLFHDSDSAGSRYDLGDMSLQCGRRVDSLKLWLSWQALGEEGYEERVDSLFELAREFRDTIVARPGFRLVREPEGPNVCFTYLPGSEAAKALSDDERTTLEGEATQRIRRELLQRGGFMVNYATLDGAAAFRLVLSNPATTPDDLTALLEEIELIGQAFE